MNPTNLSELVRTALPIAALGNIKGLPQLFGAEQKGGYNAAADLVTQTVDGTDLNDLWNDFAASVAIANEARTKIVQLLTYPVTKNIERVGQVSSTRFEVASEYGEPRGMRPSVGAFNLGYDFEWYDLAARYTWKFLAEAPASQVEANNQMALEADNALIYEKVMEALYAGNTNRTADIDGVQDVNVYGLYNNDGTVPPKFKNTTFDGTHNHYMVSGAAALEPGDFNDLYKNIAEHGYTMQAGYKHIALVNSAEGDVIRTWRIASGATYDFIPAQGNFAQLLPVDQQLLGAQPGNSYAGLNVIGSYGPWLIVEDDLFPAKYVVGTATGGPENLNNVVGLRQHANPSLRGLRLVKGPNPDYPLIDSFYQRGFGTGIRQRGAAAVMQVKATGSYAPPAAYGY